MIFCHVCGKTADTGWIVGLPPAPDSQKMGLCAEHDSFANRQKTLADWQTMMHRDVAEYTENTAIKAGFRHSLLHIFFHGGGSLSIPCLRCSVTPEKSLAIASPDGRMLYYPIAQIASYELAPMPQGNMGL